jgi:hypothetical protein
VDRAEWRHGVMRAGRRVHWATAALGLLRLVLVVVVPRVKPLARVPGPLVAMVDHRHPDARRSDNGAGSDAHRTKPADHAALENLLDSLPVRSSA